MACRNTCSRRTPQDISLEQHADVRRRRRARHRGALKHESAKDIFLFGSADLAASLIPHGLIDEFRIAVVPRLLGGGSPLFKPGQHARLKLIDSRPLSTGAVILRYEPAAAN